MLHFTVKECRIRNKNKQKYIEELEKYVALHGHWRTATTNDDDDNDDNSMSIIKWEADKRTRITT